MGIFTASGTLEWEVAPTENGQQKTSARIFIIYMAGKLRAEHEVTATGAPLPASASTIYTLYILNEYLNKHP